MIKIPQMGTSGPDAEFKYLEIISSGMRNDPHSSMRYRHFSHTVQCILGDMEWDVDLVLKSLVETAEQSTTT